MLAFENILQRIESEISQLQFTNPPKSLYEPIEYILSLGGKRIRPALTLMACNIYNNSIENAIKPALGLEVFHNFTLLHDDLMDEAVGFIYANRGGNMWRPTIRHGIRVSHGCKRGRIHRDDPAKDSRTTGLRP